MYPNRFKVLPQYLVPQHALSQLFGCCANSRWPWLKRYMIHRFIRKYQVDLQCAQEPNPDNYPDFNSFFTRSLRPETRPIVAGDHIAACPCDGLTSQQGRIAAGRVFQAKGFDFTLAELFGGETALSALFGHGAFATFYLAPKDYHRVHMPLPGQLTATIYVPGKLFSVNPSTVACVPRLFARNERLIALFDTAWGKMALVLVGAMIVGSIRTVWDTAAVRSTRRSIKTTYYDNSATATPITLAKGAEMGQFQLGSTVIVLFADDKLQFSPTLLPNAAVNMGQAMAEFSK